MKLEVGMTIRANGNFAKIIEVTEGNISVDNSKSYGIYNIPKYLIKKAKHNIIDLIEVGDYVNGYKVSDILTYCSDNEEVNGKKLLKIEKYNENSPDKLETITNHYIKLVLTKEQYQNNVYTVKE